MIPEIPVPIWEQISVVIVFAFLLAGLGWVLVRLFTNAIAEVNARYAELLKETNRQWQAYFDARSETSGLLSRQMMQRIDELTCALAALAARLDARERARTPGSRRPPLPPA